MTLPNWLTTARFFLTIVFIYFAIQGGFQAYVCAAILFAVAAVTDFLDGYLAKKYHLVTDFGKIMDPIADKFLILSAFYVFVHLQLIPLWIFILMTLREIGVTVSRFVFMRKGKVLAAEREGKIKTVLQITAVSITLLYLLLKTWPGQPECCAGMVPVVLILAQAVIGLAAAMTLYSGFTYFYHAR